VRFASRSDLMGVLANRRLTTVLAWVAAGLIVALNIFLIYQLVAGS
jgi:manganese transport protein